MTPVGCSGPGTAFDSWPWMAHSVICRWKTAPVRRMNVIAFSSVAGTEPSAWTFSWPFAGRVDFSALGAAAVLTMCCTAGQKTFQCGACRYQASAIAGTVFQAAKLLLTTWFLEIYLISQTKIGVSALALTQYLGVNYPTAWLIHHKLMQTRIECEEHCVLDGKRSHSWRAIQYSPFHPWTSV
jgi:hypothetical protein